MMQESVDEFPTEAEYWGHILDEDENQDYIERLDGSTVFNGTGYYATLLYLDNAIQHYDKSEPTDIDANLEDLKTAYRIGGLWGGNVRIGDDVLDGDGCDPLPDSERREFLENFGHALRTGEIRETPDHELAQETYKAGALTNELYSHRPELIDSMASRWDRAVELLEEEDKSTEEGYREYTIAASSIISEIIVDSLKTLDTFNPSDEFYQLVHDSGFIYQSADDWREEDIPLDRETHREVYDEYVEKAVEKGSPILSRLARLSRDPNLYDRLMKIGKIQQNLKEQVRPQQN